MDRYHPLYLLHGHVHLRYGLNIPRVLEYNDSQVVNVSERYVLEVPDRPFPEKDRGRLIWKTHPKERDD